MVNLSPVKFPVTQGINREFLPESAFSAVSARHKSLQSLCFPGEIPTQGNREFL
jgi:hypothetical protein